MITTTCLLAQIGRYIELPFGRCVGITSQIDEQEYMSRQIIKGLRLQVPKSCEI